ncbi:MAG: circadian clock protein KaiC, partial [Actinobacteria bacterium]|nr:circadian clock protein KaiC [Actinomycetota bacterium]
HRVNEQVSTRRMRIVKYRGTTHGTNEYPFLIDETGISVLPVTALSLTHEASDERVGTGVPRLDAMLGGKGVYRGTTVLVTGTAGTGKTSLAAHFADAACRRGERCLYFAFEESSSQLSRNMRSIGIDFAPHVQAGLLEFHASRPTLYGLEMHLVSMHKRIAEFRPSVVVVDPITNLATAGTTGDAARMVLRLLDYLKATGITAFFTSLTSAGQELEGTDLGVSSIVDTWLLLRDLETNGERTRGMYVLKSRGMSHSNQIREFVLTDRGIELLDVYVGPEGVLTGSARVAREAQARARGVARSEEVARRQREHEAKRQEAEAKISMIRAELEREEEALARTLAQEQALDVAADEGARALARSRHADNGATAGSSGGGA